MCPAKAIEIRRNRFIDEIVKTAASLVLDIKGKKKL
jgi:hypothetical protein